MASSQTPSKFTSEVVLRINETHIMIFKRILLLFNSVTFNKPKISWSSPLSLTSTKYARNYIPTETFLKDGSTQALLAEASIIIRPLTILPFGIVHRKKIRTTRLS